MGYDVVKSACAAVRWRGGDDEVTRQAPSLGVTGGVELFGVPRLLAGRRTLPWTGATLREVAAALATACPALVGPVLDPQTGWLLDGYTFVIDERFTTDPEFRLRPDSTVFLVSSVAGG